MKVLLRHPTRVEEMSGPMPVSKLLRLLDIERESVLVIRGGTLVPEDVMLSDDDEVEIRPVISGGSGVANSAGGFGSGAASLYGIGFDSGTTSTAVGRAAASSVGGSGSASSVGGNGAAST